MSPAVTVACLGVTLFGADRADIALICDVVWGLVLVMSIHRGLLKAAPFSFLTFRLVIGLFAVLLAYLLASTTALWHARLPHPVGKMVVAWGTIDRSVTLLKFANMLGLGCAFMSGLAIARSDRRAEQVILALVRFGAAYAAVALAFYMLQTPPERISTGEFFGSRLAASFTSANVAAGYFIVLSLLLFCSLDGIPRAVKLSKAGSYKIMARTGALILLVICLVLTASRMGIVAGAVGFATVLLLKIKLDAFKAKGWSPYLPQVMAVAAFACIVFAGQALPSRFSVLGDDVGLRTHLMALHWQAFLANPLTGYGLGTFDTLNRMLITPELFSKIWNIRAAHNVYLQWLEETGLVGSACMFAIVGLIIFEIARGHRIRTTMRWLLRAVLAACAALLLQGFADFPLQTPAISCLWALLLGVGFAVAVGGSRSRTVEQPQETLSLRRFNIWGPTGLALSTVIVGLTVLWGTSLKAVEQKFPLVMHNAYDETAMRLLTDTKTNRAVSSSSTQAERLILRSMTEAPANGYALTLQASLNPGSPASLHAFETSYAAAPLDATLFKWRTAYAARWWDQLSPDTKKRVVDDIAAEGAYFWELRGWLSALSDHYKGTAFGLTLYMTLTSSNLLM